MGLRIGEVARSGSVMALLHIEILLANKTIRVVTLPDRRPNASSSQSLKWLYQIDLDSVLYGSKGSGAGSRGWCSCGTSHSTHERGNGDVTRHELTGIGAWHARIVHVCARRAGAAEAARVGGS